HSSINAPHQCRRLPVALCAAATHHLPGHLLAKFRSLKSKAVYKRDVGRVSGHLENKCIPGNFFLEWNWLITKDGIAVAILELK
ncbi:Hypothetical predicted protein, partial [Podarcis lilfordi]